MKAKYVKPALVLEQFELTQSIANGCGASSSSTVGDPNQWNKSTCGWQVGSDIIWDYMPKCTWEVPLDEIVEGLCYNNPDGGQSIFNS